MDKFRAVWEKIDAVLFQLLRHVCAVILGALVAVVFYIFFGRYVMHNSPMWGRAVLPAVSGMAEPAGQCAGGAQERASGRYHV